MQNLLNYNQGYSSINFYSFSSLFHRKENTIFFCNFLLAALFTLVRSSGVKIYTKQDTSKTKKEK